MQQSKQNKAQIDVASLIRDAILYDIVPDSNALHDYLNKAPNSLMGDFGYEDWPKDSLIHNAISRSSFHVADFILKHGSDHFLPNIDPFFCGYASCNFDSLPDSAGLNFYLALVTIEYYAEKNNLSQLLEEDQFNRLLIKKTYCDCLYWQDSKGRAHREVLQYSEQDQGSILDFTKNTAIWFMHFAHKVFILEKELKAQLQPKSFSSQIRDSFFPPVVREVSTLYKELGDCYLHIAHMEANAMKAFCYFFKKSLDCYRKADPGDISQLELLEKCINLSGAEEITRLNKYFCSQRDRLKECGVATNNYSFDADRVWRTAFDSASEQINSQGMSPCIKLWDQEIDSGRTSSEEKDARDSDVQERQSADFSDEQFSSRIGLHFRPKAAQAYMTSNPMYGKK